MDLHTLIECSVRVMLAMFIGGTIGWERESTHRPAGFRTHMLVAVGACVIMQLGEYTTNKYASVTTLDPQRLGAQVISGIGFLGAGTIMREGLTIKGLTTAASLWVVACLGLAVGAGAYAIVIVGFIAIFSTLTIFERASLFVRGGKFTRFYVRIQCSDTPLVMKHIHTVANENNAEISDLQLKILSDNMKEISFRFSSTKSANHVDFTELFLDLAHVADVTSIKMNEF
ncbi:MAG TPA: magnesium transporter MgtC [Firmicutes bacterium]|nr:magnesium transporter MgtC [Bacillota bacterium]